MKSWRASSAVALLAIVVLGACSSSSSKPASTAAPNGTSTTLASSTTSSAAATGTATLALATNAKIGQQILVNAAGHTVYMYVPDGTSTTSKVPAAIKANWPAVTATGTPTAASGLDQTKLAVSAQADGSQQASYGGHLLYTFIKDTAPGDANGEGLGGVWYAVLASGAKAA